MSWIVRVIGFAIIVFGGYLIWQARTLPPSTASRGDPQHKIEISRDSFALKSTSLGLVVMLTGLLAFLIGPILSGHTGDGAAHAQGGIPTAPTTSPTPPQTTGARSSATTTVGGQTALPTTTTGLPTPPTTAFGKSARAVPAVPTGNTNGVQLFIEGCAPAAKYAKREQCTVRLENQSGSDVDMDSDRFIAVDNTNHSYDANVDESTLAFDDNYAGPFANGTTIRGTVVIAERLRSDAKVLQLRFTMEDTASYHDYFTVSATTVV